uniref:Putative pro-pol polyprotein n=1 Tax=Panstrongylus lignarius TaxID=156445 RepID=A0A224XMQ7_9HEMI
MTLLTFYQFTLFFSTRFARKWSPPDLDMIDCMSLNRRFNYRQKLIENLRGRFRFRKPEYFAQLIQRCSLKQIKSNFKTGGVVLIGQDNVKRLDWPVTKIIAFLPDPDGEVSVVRLLTAQGEIIRSVSRVYPLEISSDDLAQIVRRRNSKMEKALDNARF